MKTASTRKIVVTGILAAISSILMYINFALPFVPPYLKIDFSDFPALLASFSLGPLSGVGVCLIKNLVSLPASSTMGVGELSNFIISSVFVVSAGLFYKNNRTKKGALIASLIGAASMAFVAIFSNYFVVYPAYIKFMRLPEQAIIGMSSAIISWIDSTWKVILVFNMPFTFVKGILNVIITFLIYKHISPIMQGKK